MPKRCVLPLLALACGSSCFAQGAANNPHLRFSQEHHWTFSEIGDVGNAPYITTSSPGNPSRPIGGVDHRYRISTTEVTWGQYFEFIQAYAPHTPANIDSELAPGAGPIRYLGSSGGVPYYEFHQPERANQPAYQTWRVWARFCNWLNAGGPDLVNPTSADFENGAYDTSTFGRIAEGPNGHAYTTDQDRHTPGARFWIPSRDELTKATYYDPNHNGEGEGGWWRYGHSSDDEPIPGDPALGGETNAGFENEYPEGQFRPLDVGSYPDVLSPWGLLDTTGGLGEWTETWIRDEDPFAHNQRIVLAALAGWPVLLGDIDILRSDGPTIPYHGLRLAAAVPAPASAAPFAILLMATARRRRL